MEKKMTIVRCNTKGYLNLDGVDKKNGVEVVLVDSNDAPIAKYEFDGSKLDEVKIISYSSDKVRIKFEGIIPTSKYELTHP